MIITEPGIYGSLTSEFYHSDCCDGLSLGSSGARTITNECPAAFRYEVPETKEEFDIGQATHLLVLQPEEFDARIGVVYSPDWRNNKAKAERDDIRASGRIPLLAKTLEQVQAMRDAIFADPVASLAFQGGRAEQSFFWRDPEYGFWCKTRPDYYPEHGRYLVDVKTSMNANPRKFESAIGDYGYDQQAEWYMSGVEAITGIRPQKFAFVVVAKKPPHLVSVCWLKPDAIEAGRTKNRYARGVFAWCLKHNLWPSYQPTIWGPPGGFEVGLTGYAARNFGERLEAGGYEPPPLDDEFIGDQAA